MSAPDRLSFRSELSPLAGLERADRHGAFAGKPTWSPAATIIPVYISVRAVLGSGGSAASAHSMRDYWRAARTGSSSMTHGGGAVPGTDWPPSYRLPALRVARQACLPHRASRASPRRRLLVRPRPRKRRRQYRHCPKKLSRFWCAPPVDSRIFVVMACPFAMPCRRSRTGRAAARIRPS